MRIIASALLSILLFSSTLMAGDSQFDPYAKDQSDPSASGLHDIGTIDDYDYPAGKPEQQQQQKQEDPCKSLRKQKKEADKTKKMIAETMEDACISDAKKCAELRKTKKQFDKKYPELLKAVEEHGCDY